MSATVNITACDNEMYVIAYTNPYTESYEICHMISGNGKAVNLTISVLGGGVGTYRRHETIDGRSRAITPSDNYTVYIPAASQVLLVAVGIDWGGVAHYAVQFAGHGGEQLPPASFSFGPKENITPGVCWNAGPFPVNL